MRLAVLSLLCLHVACFQEPPADRVWRCTVDKPQCPEGQSCVADWCVKDGTAQPDLAVTDGGGNSDMSKPPCTNGFPIGTKGVWACRGAFSPTGTKASSLCLNGYKLCIDGTKLSSAECLDSTLKGFFFADVPAEGSTGSLAKCAMGGSGSGQMWFGCGDFQGARTPSETSAIGCKSFTRMSYCDPGIQFVCNSSDLRLDAQQMNTATNGVLCCPP